VEYAEVPMNARRNESNIIMVVNSLVEEKK
jgi:hypothetical protein